MWSIWRFPREIEPGLSCCIVRIPQNLCQQTPHLSIRSQVSHLVHQIHWAFPLFCLHRLTVGGRLALVLLLHVNWVFKCSNMLKLSELITFCPFPSPLSTNHRTSVDAVELCHPVPKASASLLEAKLPCQFLQDCSWEGASCRDPMNRRNMEKHTLAK